MPGPRQKDWFDVCIDFFFGALFGICAMGLFFSRRCQQFYNLHWKGQTVEISGVAAILVCGSLAALYRKDFWSAFERHSNIPPMEETTSKPAKIVLWMLFAIGCGLLPLLYFF